MEWLKSRNCENAVSEQIVEQYAMSVARWVHIEQRISKYGYLAKHPTTGAPMQSPYVMMSQAYMKQIIAIRAEKGEDKAETQTSIFQKEKII